MELPSALQQLIISYQTQQETAFFRCSLRKTVSFCSDTMSVNFARHLNDTSGILRWLPGVRHMRLDLRLLPLPVYAGVLKNGMITLLQALPVLYTVELLLAQRQPGRNLEGYDLQKKAFDRLFLCDDLGGARIVHNICIHQRDCMRGTNWYSEFIHNMLETKRLHVQSLTLIGSELIEPARFGFPLLDNLHTLVVPMVPYLWHEIDNNCPSLSNLTILLSTFDIFATDATQDSRNTRCSDLCVAYVKDVVVIFRRILSRLTTFRLIAGSGTPYRSHAFSRHLFMDTYETTTTGMLLCEHLVELVIHDDFFQTCDGLHYPDVVMNKLITPKLKNLSFSNVPRPYITPERGFFRPRLPTVIPSDFEGWYATSHWLEIDPINTRALLLGLKGLPLERLHLPNHTLDEDNFPDYLPDLHTVAFTLTESSKMIPVLRILRSMPKMQEVMVYIRPVKRRGDTMLPKTPWYVNMGTCACAGTLTRARWSCKCPSSLRLTQDVEDKRLLELANRGINLDMWNAAVRQLRQSTIVHQIINDNTQQWTLLHWLSTSPGDVFCQYPKPIHGMSFGELISPMIASCQVVARTHRFFPWYY
jgi:hypothetical protein